MSRFRYWLDGRRFVSMALEDARLHVMTQNSFRDTAVEAWTLRAAMWDRRNWQWILETLSFDSADMPFLRCDEELLYLLSLVNVMLSAAEKRSFHDGV